MKRLLYLLPSFFIYCLITFSAGMSSCTKTNTIIDSVKTTLTDTVIKLQIDTVKENDTLVTTALLTANAWKIEQVRAIYGTSYVFYQRGGTGNTESFDNEYISFKADGTGSYVDNNSNLTTFTWQYTDSTYRTLIWNWNLPSPVVVTWENLYYEDGAIHYTEYYTQFGNNVLTAGIRIPK